MNGKLIPFVIGVLLLLGVGGVVWLQSKDVSSPVPGDGGAVSTATYSMSDVARNAGADSCWSVIDRHVYDLTEWIGQHPGGSSAILSLCGKDGTAAFHDQHGDNQRQADILVGYKIGELAE